MTELLCGLWPYLAGGLIGWLLSGLLARRFRGAVENQVVESHLTEIDSLRAERATLLARPPEEKIVEKIVEKEIDNPVLVARIGQLEQELETIPSLRAQIQALEAKPPEIVEKLVEKVVEKRVADPTHIARIAALEKELRVVPDLKTRIANFESAPPRVVEKIVEKVVEKPVDRIVEKKVVDPAQQARIQELESQLRVVPDLRSQIAALEARGPEVVEKVVEKPVETIVERVVEKEVEKIVPDQQAIAEKDRVIADWQAKFAALERSAQSDATKLRAIQSELEVFRRGPQIDLQAAKSAGFTIKSEDDFTVIEGIGPKINSLLKDAGIKRFVELARTPVAKIQEVLDQAGPNYKLAEPETWPEQADLAASNRWKALMAWQDVLDGGKRS